MFFATPFAAMPDSLSLFVTLPGDANLDLQVEDADLSLLLANFGKTGAKWFEGDFTGDGLVDDADLSLLLANFGQSRTFGSNSLIGSNLVPQVIPEPSSLWLLGLGVGGMLIRRRNLGLHLGKKD